MGTLLDLITPSVLPVVKMNSCARLSIIVALLPRLYVALLETYQQADGTVLVPEPLRAALGVNRIGS